MKNVIKLNIRAMLFVGQRRVNYPCAEVLVQSAKDLKLARVPLEISFELTARALTTKGQNFFFPEEIACAWICQGLQETV
jgi:hypothetical protein